MDFAKMVLELACRIADKDEERSNTKIYIMMREIYKYT
jgi:hypothetical protein